MDLNTGARQILANLLEARTGQQLTPNRSWRIDTALTSILRSRGLTGIDQLVTRLATKSDPALADEVVEALLNNETFFYRDRTPFDLLLSGPLKRIQAARAESKRLRIWSAGCSTGQEPYSVAISLAEDKLRWAGWHIEIVATDVSGTALEQARKGIYSQFEVQRGLPIRQMMRWFTERGSGEWQVSRDLQDMIRFEVRSLADVAPYPGRFDVILCRNVLLYFAPEVRRRAFDRLADAIAPDGSLMLGAGETVIGQTDRFVSDPEHRGLYIRTDGSRQAAVPQSRVA